MKAVIFCLNSSGSLLSAIAIRFAINTKITVDSTAAQCYNIKRRK